MWCDGIRMTSCFKKVYSNFVIKKWEKRNSNGSQVINSRMFIKQNRKNVYLLTCQFCKQYRKQHNNNRFIPTKLTTKDSEQTIKKSCTDLWFQTLFRN